jgi:hypothetical protein
MAELKKIFGRFASAQLVTAELPEWEGSESQCKRRGSPSEEGVGDPDNVQFIRKIESPWQ